MADVVDIILRLAGTRQFVQGADQASKAIGGVGSAAEKSGKQAGVSWKSIAKWGGVAGAAYGAQRFLRGAVDTTEQLGQSTLALNRTTGMSIKQSSEWAATLQTRGVATTQSQRGLVTLSKQMTTSMAGTAKYGQKIAQLNQEYKQVQEHGGKGTVKALASIQKKIDAARLSAAGSVDIWKKLHVSMKDVASGNTEKVLEQVSDAFSKMKNPAERAALAQKLFGRAGVQLAPLLFKGSKAIKEQLGLAGKYVDFNAKNAKQVQQDIKDQRELKLAYMGVQVSLGKALLPILLAFSKLLLQVVNYLQPFIRSGWLVKAVIAALAAAFLAYKVVALAVTIQQTLMNAAFLANPITLVIVAIVALVAAIFYAWKHFKWFRDAVYDVWNALKAAFNWAKDNWPLLVAILGGPFAIVAEQIYQHWGQIVDFIKSVWDGLKSAVGGVIDWVKQKMQDLFDYILKLPKKLIQAIKALPGGSFALKALGKAADIVGGVKSFLHLQHGGTITRPGTAIVGEAGPELVVLPPAATVMPLKEPVGAFAGAGGGTVTIRVPVFLDRRQIA